MLNYHIVVTGRVQGVGFRWGTQVIGFQNGLGGQVKNEWDGSVTIDVQGPAKAVKMFVKEVQAGPNPYAKVAGMQIEPRAIESDWQDFKMQ